MKTLIVGRGEIGKSLYNVIKGKYPIWVKDVVPELEEMEGCPDQIDVMHICIRYTKDFIATVKEYIKRFKPRLINICTTVPVGTTESIHPGACHSTTRGLHPNLEEGLQTIWKHIGGRDADILTIYFEKIGIANTTHKRAKTTELLHILNNAHYGINLMFADEAQKLCREYGVDYFDYMVYTHSNNVGYQNMGLPTKVRPILTPPGGKIGGHCVTMSASLIPEDKRPPLFKRLADYNN